jgi:hypothetical protein
MVYALILRKMRSAVRAGRVVITEHALDEMALDNLLQVDLEHCILISEIVEREWDEEFHEWKYVVEGESTDGEYMAVVAKLGFKDNVVVITTFLL